MVVDSQFSLHPAYYQYVFFGRTDHRSNHVMLDSMGALSVIMKSFGSQPFGLEETKGQAWRAREGWEARAGIAFLGNSSWEAQTAI